MDIFLDDTFSQEPIVEDFVFTVYEKILLYILQLG